jgi:imidazoleglycerol-phosphate dehydratase
MGTAMARAATVERRTKESAIACTVDIDGAGKTEVRTGVGFFDHMLEILGRHALIDIKLTAKGDIEVDAHHTVEDAGIVLGAALAKALGDKAGIARMGFASVPLDEALAQATVDLSGRGFYARRGEVPRGKVGAFDTELADDFFQSLAANLGANVHVEIAAGQNAHHIIECMFKATARALRQAAAPDPRERGVPSTKGVL